MGRRITIVTAGHLATCPRMVKAADALHEAGHRIRVISTRQTPWASVADASVHRRRTWTSEIVDYSRESAALRWLATGVRFRSAQALARTLGERRPHAVAVRAFSRVHAELVRAILREPADFIYGGTTGALAAIADAGRRSGAPFAVDFEDFHCGEHDGSGDGALANEIADAVMRDVARDAVFVTAGSAAIAAACSERLGRDVIAIHNVFPLPASRPTWPREPGAPLRLYWFSQTIGAGRGLEEVLRAAGRTGAPCELHVRGMPSAGYLAALRRLVAEHAPALLLAHHAPIEPDGMVEGCRPYSIGLATEPGQTPNSALSLSNKALTYPLAGLPVILTATPGQQPLASDLGDGAFAYAPGDVDALAEGLRAWAGGGAVLERAREASWEAARRRWHWDHPQERGALLTAVERAVA